MAEAIASHASRFGHHEILNLARVHSALIMPALNGWLLGFPCVYLVNEGNVSAAAEWLSTETLVIHSVTASCPQLKVRQQCVDASALLEVQMSLQQPVNTHGPIPWSEAWSSFVQEAVLREGGAGVAKLEQLDSLCSFTVPAVLLDQHESDILQHLKIWLDGYMGSACSTCQGHYPWEGPWLTLWGSATYEVKRSVQRICL